MKRIGEDVLRARADIRTCVVGDVALDGQSGAVPAHAATPLENALNRPLHRRAFDPADVIALIAAREPDHLRTPYSAHEVAAVRRLAIGNDERLRGIDALEGHENSIQSVFA